MQVYRFTFIIICAIQTLLLSTRCFGFHRSSTRQLQVAIAPLRVSRYRDEKSSPQKKNSPRGGYNRKTSNSKKDVLDNLKKQGFAGVGIDDLDLDDMANFDEEEYSEPVRKTPNSKKDVLDNLKNQGFAGVGIDDLDFDMANFDGIEYSEPISADSGRKGPGVGGGGRAKKGAAAAARGGGGGGRGGRGGAPGRGRRRLPAGLDKKLLALSLEELEARADRKFRAALRAEEFYDEDDEGYDDPNSDPDEDQEEDNGSRQSPDFFKPAGTTSKTKKDSGSGFKLRPVQVPAGGEEKHETSPAAATSDKQTPKEKSIKQKLKEKELKLKADEKKNKKKKKTKTPIPLDPKTLDPERIISLEKLGYVGHWEGIPSFQELGVADEQILHNLQANFGILTPTSVQANALRPALAGRDVTIKAYTGSGKTLAFLLPLLEQVDRESKAVQAVVVAPSRELGAQIHGVLQLAAEDTGVRSQSLIGGANALRQIEALKKNRPHIVVGTPGRLAELALGSGKLKLGNVRHLVLDEVDMLLRPTFRSECEQLLGALGPQRQVIFASATGDAQVVRQAMDEFMKDGTIVSGRSTGAGRAEVLPSNLAHVTAVVPQEKQRLEVLRRFMHTEPFPESCVVFVNEQHRVEVLVQKLYEMGIVAAPLHGDASKEDRREVLRRLQDGRLAMVVTTELAARGLDVPQLSHVVNYDLPTDGEHYVHRAGRCGRAGNPGIVLSLVTPRTRFVAEKFARQLRVPFQEVEIKHARILLREQEVQSNAAQEGEEK